MYGKPINVIYRLTKNKLVPWTMDHGDYFFSGNRVTSIQVVRQVNDISVIKLTLSTPPNAVTNR